MNKMLFPQALETQFELVEDLATSRILQCFRVRDIRKNGRASVLRLLPTALAKDLTLVDEFHRFFSKFSEIANRSYIPSVYSIAGAVGGAVYVLEEYVAGIPLPVFAEKRRHLPGFWHDVVDVLCNVCEALHHAHQKGIFHLCITPEDILVDEANGRVKLVGFGTQIFYKGDYLASLSEECKRWIAPEVLKGEGFGPYSDVYCLGAIMSAVLPGLGETGNIVEKAMSPNPQTRYARVRELESKLSEAFKEKRGEARLPSESAVHPQPAFNRGGLKPVLSIRLLSEPENATVKADGKFLGATTGTGLSVPWTRNLALTIEKAGYQAETLTFTTPPERTEIKLKLKPILIKLRSDPVGASVRIGGRAIGVTTHDGLLTPWDQGEIVIEKDGHRPERVKFESAPVEPVITVKLIPTISPELAEEKTGQQTSLAKTRSSQFVWAVVTGIIVCVLGTGLYLHNRQSEMARIQEIERLKQENERQRIENERKLQAARQEQERRDRELKEKEQALARARQEQEGQRITPPPPTTSPPSMSHPWLFPDSSSRYLTHDDLRYLSMDQLWVARNEIFARRGYRFQTNRGITYGQRLGSHYTGADSDASRVYNSFNVYERDNVELIKQYERRR